MESINMCKVNDNEFHISMSRSNPTSLLKILQIGRLVVICNLHFDIHQIYVRDGGADRPWNKDF